MNAKDMEVALSKIHTNDFFITECKNGATWFGEHSRMDAVAIKKSWEHPCVTVYEVKVSRQDFLRDDKWPRYLDYSNRFSFACPSGLINPEDIPDPRVGLIWVNENGKCIYKKSVPVRPTEIPADFFKYILYSRIDSERIPFVSDRQMLIEEYLKDRKSSRELAWSLQTKLAQRVSDQQEKIEDLERRLKNNNGAFYEELRAKLREIQHSWFTVDEIVELYKKEEKFSSIERFVNIAKEVAKLEEVKV